MLQGMTRDVGFIPKIDIMSNNHEVLVNNIMKNNTLALLPIQLKDFYDNYPLTWVPIKDKIKPFDIVVIHKKNTPLSPAAALCLEFLTSQKIIND
ncbi:hypothetical protein [Melissococcus sp. OM08-11BH]|uniref:hypothetical protein n=2 Tax=Enterococcaceae TaxID=81852 RepID=UPI000E4EED6A|nr:hypothetical protein [Melissococcus sp. OM08-11BH]RGI32417.1 hypothetical protein DXC12_03710 [Melissococcus sp. OM08-11BH]